MLYFLIKVIHDIRFNPWYNQLMGGIEMFKEFMKYYRLNQRLFLIDMFFSIAIIVFQILIPIGTRLMINDYIPNQDLQGIVQMTIVLIIVTFMFSISNYVRTYYGHVLGANIEKTMRIKLFSHFQKLEFAFFDQYKTGQILSRITSDMNYISEFAHHGAEEVCSTVVIVVIGIFYLGSINLSLMLFFYILIVIHFSILYVNRKKLTENMQQVRHELGEVNAQTESSIASMRLTRAFNNEELEIEKFIESNESYRDSWKKAYKSLGETFAVNNFFVQIQTVLLMGIGAVGIYKNVITFGDLIAFLLFFQILISSISRIMNMLEAFEQGITSFNRYQEIMEIEPKIKENSKPIKLEQVDGLIEFNQVEFGYNEQTVLNELTFTVPSGQMVALVGPSGVGKSTALQLIPRFYETISGKITIDGIDIKDISFSDLRNNIGYVQQDVVLFYGTIRDNILYGKPDATDLELQEAVRQAKLSEFIDSLPEGLDTQVGEKGIILSGGQKQRISIARIFLKNPPILLLDEATSALDTLTERYIQEQIDELAKNRTVIVVAHRLSTVRRADNIIVLDKNGIVESGTHQQLMDQKGSYFTLNQSEKSELH